MDIATLRTAIKQRLEGYGIPRFRVEETWPNLITPPQAGCHCAIWCVSAEYGQTFGTDMTIYRPELHLFVSMANGFPTAETNLSPYIANTGSASILQAIRQDPYLGNTVSYCLPPTGYRDYGEKLIGPEGEEVLMFGAVIDLEVYAR